MREKQEHTLFPPRRKLSCRVQAQGLMVLCIETLQKELTVHKSEKSIPDSVGNTEYRCHNYKIPNTEIMKTIFMSIMENQ